MSSNPHPFDKDWADEQLARMSTWQHVKAGISCFFSFLFIESITEFVFAIQRFFHIGHYGKWGRFTRILNKPIDRGGSHER